VSTPRRHSIRDVARRASVSIATVSNVLNNPELVAEATRARVLAAIAELGFVPNGPARQLRAGRAQAVGVVVLDLANPFFTEVVRGVEDRVTEADGLVIVCSSDDNPSREARHLRMLEQQGVRGVLVTPAQASLDVLSDIRSRGTPVVLLDHTADDMCAVAVDDVRGGELAAAHLLELGHRRIAFLNGPDTIRQCADRRRGIHRAIQQAGLDPQECLLEVTLPALNADAGEASLNQLLAHRRPPTAIACVNDVVALGVLRGLRRRGMTVPDDIAVTGYDDVEFAGMLSTPLTSVRQPKYQLGHTAADLLLTESTEGTTHEHRQILFQPELVVRASSVVS